MQVRVLPCQFSFFKIVLDNSPHSRMMLSSSNIGDGKTPSEEGSCDNVRAGRKRPYRHRQLCIGVEQR